MTTVQVNGTELYYEERGSGPPLLLMHGTGAYADLWAPGNGRARPLLSRDCLRPTRTRPLVGQSLLAISPTHALMPPRSSRRSMPSPATVVGWSGGGAVALGLAASSPKLVLSSSSPSLPSICSRT